MARRCPLAVSPPKLCTTGAARDRKRRTEYLRQGAEPRKQEVEGPFRDANSVASDPCKWSREKQIDRAPGSLSLSFREPEVYSSTYFIFVRRSNAFIRLCVCHERGGGMRSRLWGLMAFAIGATLFGSPSVSFAQTNIAGSITGTVRDNTGAVLPGVTVEASSPALIEKVRSTVTDDQGIFTIVNLSPGIYEIRYTLSGFSPVVREGVQITVGFTATAHAEMRVGGQSETITVTGASPIVDLRNTNQQAVISRELLDAIPTAQNFAGLASLSVGV